MDLMGFTLNFLSLLALALVAGVLVDDAIVEIENIVRHMRMGKSAYQASIDAADEIGLAVVATTFSIVAVFLPVGLMPGVSGQFFKNFGLTVVVAVLMSLAVARMITPMMAAYFLKAKGQAEHGEGPMMDRYMRCSLDARHRQAGRAARAPRASASPASSWTHHRAVVRPDLLWCCSLMAPEQWQCRFDWGSGLKQSGPATRSRWRAPGWAVRGRRCCWSTALGGPSGVMELIAGLAGYGTGSWTALSARPVLRSPGVDDGRRLVSSPGDDRLFGQHPAAVSAHIADSEQPRWSRSRWCRAPRSQTERGGQGRRACGRSPRSRACSNACGEGRRLVDLRQAQARPRAHQRGIRARTDPRCWPASRCARRFQSQRGGGGGSGRDISVMLSGSDPVLLEQTARRWSNR
jgi:hypothetical protein